MKDLPSKIFVMAAIVTVAAAVVVAYHPWRTERESVLEYAFHLGQQAARGDTNEAYSKFDRRFHGDQEARGSFMKGTMSAQNAQRSAS